jgi:predicted nucleotidyltransferase
LVRIGGESMTFKKMENELINGLIDIFGDNLSRIILYGSVARNEDTVESDIDIAVITVNPISSDVRDLFIRWSAQMDLKYDCVLSIIDIEKEKFDTWKNTLPFYRNVSKEGVTLWTAA